MIESFHEHGRENKEQRIIELLKERGMEDTETRELFLAWLQEQEQIAEQAKGNDAYIQLEVRKARLYRAAGHEEEAWNTFNAARRMATQENNRGVLQDIEDEMDNF